MKKIVIVKVSNGYQVALTVPPVAPPAPAPEPVADPKPNQPPPKFQPARPIPTAPSGPVTTHYIFATIKELNKFVTENME